MAQWSVHSPFTSEVAGSILGENFLNVARTQCSTHMKRVSQHSAESRGFSPGTPVSSQREVDRLGEKDCLPVDALSECMFAQNRKFILQ